MNFVDPLSPRAEYTPPEYDGISKEECLRIRAAHVNPAVHRQTFHKDKPLMVAGELDIIYWAALSLSFRRISIPPNLYFMFMNIIAWGPQVRYNQIVI